MGYQKIYGSEFLAAKRLVGDPVADAFILQVFRDADQKKELQQWLNRASGNHELKALAEIFPGLPLIKEAAHLPAWADQKLMKAGSDFFIRHSTTIMSLLGLMSLPYCYTAANGARVLYLSERMRTDATKRLYETAIFVWEAMAPDAFAPTGKAFTETFKVRLMHAAVRYYTLQSEKWDDSWGVPINQEDMAGTNLSFSLIVIRGLRLLGFTINQADQVAFIHLWNVIGFLSGLDEDLIPAKPGSAVMLDAEISRRQFAGSAHGRELTSALTAHIISVNKGKVKANDILGLMKYLLGKDVAATLSIDVPDLPKYKISLLRTTNLIKSFMPQVNTDFTYQRAYSTFKSQKPL